MSAVPPSFGDLGKSARDLFDKEFGKDLCLVRFVPTTKTKQVHVHAPEEFECALVAFVSLV